MEKKARRKRENDKKSAPGGAIIDVYVFFSNAKSNSFVTNFVVVFVLLTSEHTSVLGLGFGRVVREIEIHTRFKL